MEDSNSIKKDDDITSSTDNVYIKSEEVHGWIPARVISTNNSFATVQVHPRYELGDDDCRLDICLDEYASSSLPLQNVNVQGKLQEVHDMVDLPFLHEAGILYNLKARHERGVPYTRTGEIIIAVNPYQWNHDHYSVEKREIYSDKLIWTTPESTSDHRTLLDPHVYETSCLAYRGLASDQSNQSILVSGESGAGKTETVKILMSHLSSIQSEGLLSREVIKRVLDSNPLLEAFGNAQTLKNDNSSRFGKFLKLQWHVEDLYQAAYSGKILPSCTLAGSVCSTYLLEKSRVVGHEMNERNFHVFYQLLLAPEEHKAEIWEGLLSKTEDDFSYLGQTKIHAIEGSTDSDRFLNTIESLKLLGLSMDVIYTLFQALCIVLQLGNIRFACDETNDEQSYITNEDELESLSSLMGVPSEEVKSSVTVRTIVIQKEVMNVPLNPTVAKDSCDALAKEIYSVAFNWLVKAINDATCAESNYENASDVGDTENYGIIGLLDIFGFESFEVNRFEQMCINYANEKLQQKFTTDMFKSVQEEYSAEGIDLGDIQFTDNQDILNLFDMPLGLLSVLNEECVRPKGNDVSFVMKVYDMNKQSEYLIEDNFFREYEFCIHHYAGQVIYDATNFVKKNMDTLPPDLQVCICKSTNSIIQSGFENLSSVSSSTSRKQTRRGSLVQQSVSTKFRNQLTILMNTISQTKTRYIRCIKPNSLKKPRILDHKSTVEQLRSAGVVAAISISRASFPNRLKLNMAWYRFSCLVPKKAFDKSFNSISSNILQEDKKVEQDLLLRSKVNHLLEMLLDDLDSINKTRKVYTCGRTRVYFRAGSLEYLEARRLAKLDETATRIQACTRRYFDVHYYRKLKKYVVLMQARALMCLTRRWFLSVKSSVITIQCWVRYTVAHDVFMRIKVAHNVTTIQSFWRMCLAKLELEKAHAASTVIQAMIRGSMQRPRFRKELLEAKEDARMDNQLQVLQCKLEDAERRRKEAEKVAEEKGKELLHHQTTANEEDEDEANRNALTSQQQELMDESHKMLEYLRKEVSNLKHQNSQLRTDFDGLKENNHRLMEANASAGASFQALNQHAKTITVKNATLSSNVDSYKQKLSDAHMYQMELKEGAKMKQDTYIAEVQSRLQYQKALHQIVEMLQSRCRDDKLLDDVLNVYETAESGLGEEEHAYHAPLREEIIPQHTSIASPPRGQAIDKSLSSRFFSYFVSPGDGNDNDHEENNEIEEHATGPDSEEPQPPIMGTGLLGLQTLNAAYSEA